MKKPANRKISSRFFFLLLFILVSQSKSELCWEASTRHWNLGLKTQMTVQVEEMQTSWNIGIAFLDEIISLEAWRGNVFRNGNMFNITSKCYNGIIFPCQCLSFDYIVRHHGTAPENVQFYFNGENLPACNEPLDCEIGGTTVEHKSTTPEDGGMSSQPNASAPIEIVPISSNTSPTTVFQGEITTSTATEDGEITSSQPNSVEIVPISTSASPVMYSTEEVIQVLGL